MNYMYEDLPEEVKAQLSGQKPKEYMRVQIVELLCKHGVMSLDDLVISFWKDCKKVVTRKTIHTRLSELCDCGKIERVARGLYKSGGVT